MDIEIKAPRETKMCMSDGGGTCVKCGTGSYLLYMDGYCRTCWTDYAKENLDLRRCEHCHATHAVPKGSEPTRFCWECVRAIRPCKRCGTDTPYGTCHPCQAEAKAEEWWQTVPPLYQTSTLDHLPCRDAYDSAVKLRLRNIQLGIYMWGATGTGKTRTSFLMAREWVRIGWARAPVFMRGQQFAKEVVERTRPDGTGGFDRWMSSLVSTDLLILDEVDKVKLSERVTSELFDLFERRLSSQRPMIFTSNVMAEQFSAGFGDNYRDAVARRLTEFFTPIRFKA